MNALKWFSIVAIVWHTLLIIMAGKGLTYESPSYVLGCITLMYCLALPHSIVALIVSYKNRNAPTLNITDEIANLHKLVEIGAINQIEYNKKKEELLTRF